MDGLHAAALVHRHVHDHGALLHPLQVLALDQVGRLGARQQHRAHHEVRLLDPLQDVVAVAVDQLHVGRHHVGQVAQAVQRHVQDGHAGAQAGRHLGRVRAHHAAADDDHVRRRHARHAAQQHAAAAVELLQVLGARLDCHPPRHLGHGREQRQLAAGQLHRLVRDAHAPLSSMRARERLVRREVEVREQELVRAACAAYSTSMGSLTFMIISARAHTSSTSCRVAPTASYCSSVKPLPRPPPRSTITWWPDCTSASAPAGTRAMRFSLVFISFGTPISIVCTRSGSGLYG